MLGDGCTCGLGWVLPTALPDRGARHPSLQGTSRAACSQAPEGHLAQEFTFSSRGQMGRLSLARIRNPDPGKGELFWTPGPAKQPWARCM